MLPDFISELEDQRIKVGESLLYRMADNANQFGAATEVSIDRVLNHNFEKFVNYDPIQNAIVVDGEDVVPEMVGFWTVTVTSEYVDPKGTYQKFEESF